MLSNGNVKKKAEKNLTGIPLELLIVDQETAKELQCGICLQILQSPRQCKNGHLFCLYCINKSISDNPQCPECRCSMREDELGRSLFVEKHLRMLKVWCRYHFVETDKDEFSVDEDGCYESLALELVPKHEKTCGFKLVSCPYSAQCGKIRKNTKEEHMKTCVYRPKTCEFCEKGIQVIEMENHLTACAMVPVSCEHCGVELKRGELEDHLQNYCPEQIVKCPFQDQGCEKMIVRKELEDHLTSEVGYHLSMMKTSFDSQLSNIKTEYENQLQLRDVKIRALEKCKESVFKVEWKVKNYSSVRRKAYLQSEKFTICEFVWFIGFYTDGDNEESKGHVSVYLFLDVNNGHIPKNKSITLEYSLKFINHKDPVETVKREFKTTFPIKGGQGWGDRKAVKSVKLTNEDGYLNQDTLTVVAEIIVKKMCFHV